MRRGNKKNYWGGLMVGLLFWVILAVIVWFVDPESIANWPIPGGYALFFGVFFLSVLFSASLLLADSKRGLLVATVTIVWGYLKLWRIINWWGSLLLAGLLIIAMVYLWGRSDNIASKDADIKSET